MFERDALEKSEMCYIFGSLKIPFRLLSVLGIFWKIGTEETTAIS